jgi:ATP-dependent RNA helicase DDX31/DBP7
LAAAQPRISRGQGTHALVVCPTRELCLQVADVLAMLLRRFVWLVSHRTVSGALVPFCCWVGGGEEPGGG